MSEWMSAILYSMRYIRRDVRLSIIVYLCSGNGRAKKTRGEEGKNISGGGMNIGVLQFAYALKLTRRREFTQNNTHLKEYVRVFHLQLDPARVSFLYQTDADGSAKPSSKGVRVWDGQLCSWTANLTDWWLSLRKAAEHDAKRVHQSTASCHRRRFKAYVQDSTWLWVGHGHFGQRWPTREDIFDEIISCQVLG